MRCVKMMWRWFWDRFLSIRITTTEPKFKSLVTELMLPSRIDLCSSSSSSSSAHKYGRAESLGVRQQASARALRSRLCELRERESPRASPVRHLLVWLTGPGQQASARAVAIPPLPATVIYIWSVLFRSGLLTSRLLQAYFRPTFSRLGNFG